MKKRIAVGVAGTICVLGLAYVPASPLEAGFAKEKKTAEDDKIKPCTGRPYWDEKAVCMVNGTAAEKEAWTTMQNLESYCRARGLSAEAWAEINTTQPKGYEVIGECTGPPKTGS